MGKDKMRDIIYIVHCTLYMMTSKGLLVVYRPYTINTGSVQVVIP